MIYLLYYDKTDMHSVHENTLGKNHRPDNNDNIGFVINIIYVSCIYDHYSFYTNARLRMHTYTHVVQWLAMRPTNLTGRCSSHGQGSQLTDGKYTRVRDRK